jgi:RimJ/RimL family protein N-acetyltransferase
MKTQAEFMSEFYDKYFSASPKDCFFAVLDKVTAPGEDNAPSNYAGLIGLNSTDRENAVTEIGITIFPAFQGTHVTTNAIGLLLMWALDPPPAGGLGLRRVEWKTHVDNEASRRTALRMGFEFEGIARWQRVFPHSAVGLPVEALEKRNGTKGELPGRHTAIFALVWDEWDDKRPGIVALMARKR